MCDLQTQRPSIGGHASLHFGNVLCRDFGPEEKLKF